MKRIKTTFLVWLLILVLGQPTTLQPAGAFSIGTEREIGEKLLYSVRSAFSLVDDPDIVQYITSLGRNVLEVAGVQYFDYHFFVIDNKEFNAFAAPSGLIFFHSGLIATMQSEDELVSVLAHEIGHIVKRHLASRVEKGTYTSVASLGLALAAVAFGGAAAPALLTGALATGQSMNLHFSRQHEEEADLLAYGWMKKLGRN
ncbi:MAG: M48 family metalloprotease, partial [Desulforhopalus sp.]|nr:M48 family metalloprotease [Desulforhopalus sp.]